MSVPPPAPPPTPPGYGLPGPTGMYPPPAPGWGPPRTSRTGLIIGLVVGGVVVLVLIGVVGLVAFGFLLDSALTHDLVDTDFAQSADPFETGSQGTFSYEVVDGTYQITALRTLEGDSGPALSYGEFARVAYAFDLTATVTAVDGLDAEAAVGIGCAETASTGGASAQSIFVFFAGESQYALVHFDASAGSGELQNENVIAVEDDVAGVGAGDTIGLSCRESPFDEGEIVLEASVNGERVMGGSHDVRYAGGGFDAMVLAFGATEAEQQVRFGEARAIVPGE